MDYTRRTSSITFEETPTHWQALRLFDLYRFLLATGCLSIVYLHIQINFIGTLDEHLFQKVSILYFFVSLFFWICSLIFEHKYTLQANVPIFIDVIIIILIMHASGGIISGVGILLVVIVAAHSLLVPGRLSLLSAAIAAIGIFLEHSYGYLAQNTAINMFTQVGLLGSVILATAFVTNLLSNRIIKSELLVENQAELLATAQHLNAHIVSAMHAGVLVLDNDKQIRLINLAAKQLLGLQDKETIHDIFDLPSQFIESFQAWEQKRKSFVVQHSTSTNAKVRYSFHHLGKGLPAGTLVFIYNAIEENRHAQDLKLASLGHLTANIAHELRNPLGAASHAAQLLAESTALSQEEERLIKMIKQSCDRMNTVIQNVLSLSGRKAAESQRIAIIPWLEQFIQDLVIPHIPHPKVKLEYDKRHIYIDVDPTQLTQILINLCENGLRYSIKNNREPVITLRVKTVQNPNAVTIDVIDEGGGVSPSHIKHIFEPFFTTEKSGSGLGLYIARELSQMNGALLDYHPHSNGSQFRLTIPQGEV